ncbi:Dicer-like protein 2 [Friedmanniomyces endolithicus]|uniref:Dicer-like protein 2 n=1 Tax=Friedmanniomyces endolithicus TaxID=329885 RepID=A0AAN6QV50_9PEZI|nr:Dicer-like protein 2 [Friedmanniomyces endolithicus]KAK0813185.1 Dicer-like protein 2 [Friedmanniomyces endolithicus]KAK0814883.1 Dicer-like protein 2 [Friedmanniomyces endolithicus]KAK0820375.1 Dicer-like protein 2 [Friedmanniomyces endolithicus]KAK0841747.1 Dicer-like protein 2 [Friedmanniomyces endolithicus]
MGDRDSRSDDCLRGYQQEMLDASLRSNSIVVMPTGSGKTLVAVARIRAELERSAPTKLIWFLADSVELSRQQLGVIRTHLPAYQVISLTGQDGVDNWSRQHIWDAVLANVRIVVGTPAVLKDALTHGFVRISRLALLVFDEAHHCIKNHPMNAIMKNFYHPAKLRAESMPAVLGLTASPVFNPRQGGMTELESNMDATVATPTRTLDELMKYVYPVPLTLLTHQSSNSPDYPGSSSLCWALDYAAAGYDFSTDPYIVELTRYDDERSRRDLDKVRLKRKTRCSEQLRILNRKAATLYDQLGVHSAETYVHNCVERFEAGAIRDLVLPDTTMSEQQHLLSILQALPGPTPFPERQQALLTPKAECLIALLAQQATSFISEGKVIVFAKERATVVVLKHMLRSSPSLEALYSVGGFVGTSTFAGRASVADLAEPRQQARDLVDFRNGTKNLMVATSVLEEGIDVRECNLVVNFDAPDTLIGYVQRRGRARMQDSKYYILALENDARINPLKWQGQEARMKQEYMNAFRERTEAESQDEEAVNTRVYRIASTGALVTFDEVKAHLSHFCSVSTLRVSNYVDTRPDYVAQQSAKGWTAIVTLPSFLHEDIRTASSAEVWHSEAAAIKDAAFEAYVALHKADLLSDNLLPLVAEPSPEEGEQHADQPSLVEVADRTSSWCPLAHQMAKGCVDWHRATVTFAGHEDLDPLAQEMHFSLYWNEQVSYIVTVSATRTVRLDPGRLEVLRRDTDIALRTVHGPRMPIDGRIDTMLLLDLPKPLDAGHMPCTEYLRIVDKDSHGLGLVHVNGQQGLSYMLQRLDKIQANSENGEHRLVVKRFPKRKDFLHEVPRRQSGSVAYTSEESLLASECSVDKVPLKTCLIAAFLPSVMHRIDVRLIAQSLQATVLEKVNIMDTSLIIEAISSPSAGEARDYNRLEYLGDSILKYCASIQAMAQNPTWPERYLSSEKTRLVRNRTLSQAALKLGLDKFILTRPFTGAKWSPVYVGEVLAAEQDGTREMSSKILADVVEALIGAAYMDGGLEKAYLCIRTFLPDETWHLGNESFNRLTLEPTPHHQSSLEALERLIGHHFDHPTLLVEAITHASLPFQRTGMSYERLEFLGDAVLDLIIVPKLHAHPRRLRHNELHSMHEALVNGLFLGYCSMTHGIEEQQSNVVKQGDKYAVQQSPRSLHLHDFIRASGQLLHAKQTSLEAFEQYGDLVTQALDAGVEYPWPDLLALGPQKFFSDVVESVLGAVYIDSRGDLGVCEGFLMRLGVMGHMRRFLEGDMETMQPKERLGVAAGNETVKYVGSSETVEGRKVVRCAVEVGDREVDRSPDCHSRAEAEARAALAAVEILQECCAPAKRRKLKDDLAASSGAAEGGLQREHEDDDDMDG